MWYAIYSHDRPDSLQARQSARAGHLERLQDLLQEGRLLLAGPRPAIDNACMKTLLRLFESLDAARAWADADPYVAAGVYASVEVTPFKRVLPK